MIKILFFDIDGTLLELGKKEMHQELIIALNEVKKKGIKINVIKLRDDEPSRYYCLDGIFI